MGGSRAEQNPPYGGGLPGWIKPKSGVSRVGPPRDGCCCMLLLSLYILLLEQVGGPRPFSHVFLTLLLKKLQKLKENDDSQIRPLCS